MDLVDYVNTTLAMEDLTIAKYVDFMYVGHLQTLVGMRTYVDEI